MKWFASIFVFLLVAVSVQAQEPKPAFWNDVQEFKHKDSISFPPRNAILLVGSSSFTLWKDVQDYFPKYVIINRGFGGSTINDQIRYVKDIVYPYYPKQILIYCGENDIASSDTVTGRMVYNRFVTLYNLIRKKYKHACIVYISMKPSPSRQLMLPRMREGNSLVRDFLKTKKRTGYIDVYKEMIDDEGKPLPDLFREDNLHMNSKGYAIWQRLIQPYLLK